MLAYVFTHRPAPGADIRQYEDALREFHRQLASMRLRGFISSRTYRIGDGYSDWYMLETSDAMDALNDAAVTGERAASHDTAARLAVDGVGKLLSLSGGAHDADALFETRFAKPAGMPYVELYAGIRPVVESARGALWRRMMVLGPPPEFCITAPVPPRLPAAFNLEVVRRAPI